MNMMVYELRMKERMEIGMNVRFGIACLQHAVVSSKSKKGQKSYRQIMLAATRPRPA